MTFLSIDGNQGNKTNFLKINNEVREVNINFVINIPATGLSLKGPVSLNPRDGYPNISLPIKY